MGNISTTTDTLFAPLTVATAPEASRPMLEKVQKSLAFIPNLMAIFANNATVLEGISLWAPCSRSAPSLRTKGRSFCWLRVSRITAIIAQLHIHKSRRPFYAPLLKSLHSERCAVQNLFPRELGERTCARTRLCKSRDHSKVPHRRL